MKEDTALTLRKAYDTGEQITDEMATDLLRRSELVEQLLLKPKQRPELFVGIRAYEWRLVELSEIPFAGILPEVREWMQLLVTKTFTPEGFSLTGHRDGVLACHNALISTLLMKNGFDERDKIDAGISWILKYQSLERGEVCCWTGKDLNTRFGGCMKKVPCYYGVVKSMVALTEYKKRYGASPEIDSKLHQGLEYILRHEVFKKLSTGEPIEGSIVKNFYPFSYKSNLIEILLLLKDNGRHTDPRCAEATKLLLRKKGKDGYWRAEISQMKSAWIDFDALNMPGEWISYVVGRLLGG